MVTQPLASNAATSALPATSWRVFSPCVMLPTLQLPWSAGSVTKVRSVALTQNTHPADTFPVRPSDIGAGMMPSYAGIPAGTSAKNVMAIGDTSRLSNFCSSPANACQSCVITSPCFPPHPLDSTAPYLSDGFLSPQTSHTASYLAGNFAV